MLSGRSKGLGDNPTPISSEQWLFSDLIAVWVVMLVWYVANLRREAEQVSRGRYPSPSADKQKVIHGHVCHVLSGRLSVRPTSKTILMTGDVKFVNWCIIAQVKYWLCWT